ncbi:MAG: ferritin family protein [Candidatus Riflebacteria bacterium]|nr:ferritin family protein [Candidatus Riflebacteria bacterium]
MSTRYDGDTVLRMAMELEKVGQEFYEALGSACDDDRVAKVCFWLGAEELKHYRTFEAMSRRLPLAPREGKNEELELLTHDLVLRQIIPRPDVVRRVGTRGHYRDALEMALRMERDTVRFFGDLRRLMTEDELVLGQIIQEELIHVDKIAGLIAMLGTRA